MNRTLAASAAALLALTSAVARAQPPPAPAPSAAPAPSTDPNGAAPPGDANAPPGGASAPPGDAAGAPAGEPTAAAAAGASAKEGPVEVRVIGDKADSLQKVPGSGTVVTRQEIQRADPYNMAEMLRRVPGVQVREEFGGGQRLDISVRGLEAGRSRRVLVLEDGVPISLNPYAEPDLYYAPPVERMRGIEVVKGSGSILFGPQTIGGVVNFLTLAPEDRQRAAVDFEGGNLGYMRGLAMYGDSFHGVRHVTQVLYRRGNGIRDEAFEQTDIFSKVAFDTSDHGEATLKLGFHDDSADSDDVGLTRQMYKDTPDRPTLAPYGHLHLRRYDVSFIHEERISDDVKLRTLAYAYDTNRIWRRQDYQRVPIPGTPYDRIVGDPTLPYGAIYFEKTDTILDRDYQVAGIEPRVEARTTTGSVGHTFDFGARLLSETAHYQQRAGSSPISYSGSLEAEEKHRTLAVAGYVQDRLAFRDDLLVTPGLRLEHAEFHRAILRQNQGAGAQDVNIEGDTSASGVIPGVGMIYGTRKAHVFGGLHVGWAAPRVTSSISPKGTPAQVSAERSINYEIGTRVTPTKWLHAETTGFLSDFQNQVVLNTSQDLGATETDAGNTRHFGVEGGTTLGIGRLFGWPTLVDVGARYTFARAVFVGGPYGGNLLPYAPLHNFNANFDVEHRSGLGGQVAYAFTSSQFSDSQNTIAEDATGRVGILPAHHIVDATAHWHQRATGLTFRLTVKNALNDLYIIARRPEGIFAAGFRQVMFGVRWDWEAKQGETPAAPTAPASTK